MLKNTFNVIVLFSFYIHVKYPVFHVPYIVRMIQALLGLKTIDENIITTYVVLNKNMHVDAPFSHFGQTFDTFHAMFLIMSRNIDYFQTVEVNMYIFL